MQREPITVVYAAGSNTPMLDNPVLECYDKWKYAGRGYMSVTDPIRNEYPILKIVRSDGRGTEPIQLLDAGKYDLLCGL